MAALRLRRRLAQVAGAALVLAWAASCTKHPPPEPPSTTFDEPEFRVTMPGGWNSANKKSGGGDYTFASPARRETVTVTAVSLPGEDARSVVDRLVELRRAAVQRTAPGAALTATTFEEAAGTMRARFQATDAAAGTVTSCLFVATQTEALTVAFFEAGNPSAADAEGRAEQIFATFAAK